MQLVNIKQFITLRPRWAWYLYDFGNSAYAAVILLAVYSAYFKGTVVGGAEGSRLWGVAVGIAMLVVAVSSPILGAIADYSSSKKKFLIFFTTIACVFTGSLIFVKEGNILAGMILFILAEIGYRSAQVFYNAFLPEITTPDEMGKVSGNGWAIGSLGGIICLLFIMPPIVLIGGAGVVRASFLFTAIFFAISAAPLALWLHEKEKDGVRENQVNYLSIGFKQIARTFKSIRKYKELLKFMVAFLIYNDGIIMALNFAAILGAVLFGLDQQTLIIFMIIVQITSVAGAYFFGQIAHRSGLKTALLASLFLMIATVSWMYFNQSILGFFMIGGLAGFSLTGVQSVSRSMIGVLSPPEQSGEFYGFFAVAGRTSSFIGPAVFGWLAADATLRYLNSGFNPLVAEQMGHRVALLSIIVFLVLGFSFLLFTKNKVDNQTQNT